MASHPSAGGSRSRHPNPLVAKLLSVTILSDEDIDALDAVCADARELPPRRNIIREGDRPDHVHLIVEGWAARYNVVADGGRQITAFLIPGDFCDVHVTILGEMDHSIATVGPAKIAYIHRSRMDALMSRPRLACAFWWATLVDEAVLRAWIVNIGQREAFEAVGHLLCELYCRMKNVGLTTDHSFELPLTQEEIADALGLTPVHVNRVLQRLRSDDLISLQRHALVILDYPRLEKVSGFNPKYLHIERRRDPPV